MITAIINAIATAFILGSFFTLAVCAVAPLFIERPQDPR